MKAVILAGGRGVRLRPYTTTIPKPLMPLGDEAILDAVLRQLARHGFEEAVLAVGYQAELIMAYVGDGARRGIPVRYAREDVPLGTAGALGTVEGLTDPFLVMNGDVLADIDFGALRAAHDASGAVATVVGAPRDIRIDLGVLEADPEGWVTGYTEKPTYHFLASAGIYVLDPTVRSHIPRGQPFDLPDLVLALIAAGQKVRTHLHRGYWLDIGRHDDYERAQRDFDELRRAIFGSG